MGSSIDGCARNSVLQFAESASSMAGKGKSKLNIDLTEDESLEVQIKESEGKDTEIVESFVLVGKLLTTRPFNSQALKTTMKGAWKLRNGFLFNELGQNLFLFHFTI